jgi:metal-dependent amidase/aminoacylase/carboxypeptidase family protein
MLGAPVTDPAESQRALEKLDYPGPSTDFADLSWIVPGIHWWCSLGDAPHVLHTPEFAEAAGSADGDRAVLLASQVMAMTAVDILTTPGCVERITEEFHRYREEGFAKVPGIPPDFAPLPTEA